MGHVGCQKWPGSKSTGWPGARLAIHSTRTLVPSRPNGEYSESYKKAWEKAGAVVEDEKPDAPDGYVQETWKPGAPIGYVMLWKDDGHDCKWVFGEVRKVRRPLLRC